MELRNRGKHRQVRRRASGRTEPRKEKTYSPRGERMREEQKREGGNPNQERREKANARSQASEGWHQGRVEMTEEREAKQYPRKQGFADKRAPDQLAGQMESREEKGSTSEERR